MESIIYISIKVYLFHGAYIEHHNRLMSGQGLARGQAGLDAIQFSCHRKVIKMFTHAPARKSPQKRQGVHSISVSMFF
jgi:hypothetical protein